ncbi:hypothetical protein [Priestia megaterium]|uniref:hypothetical protein n=1 Tax=Priestia megaterium TaxID=1404 RepID=UPI00112BC768|nr:hypothetical protein [Priestia megaterium]TPF18034.1 hypothetical protein CBE78_02065 [Priestia megaterium]TPF22141.1 hypothetical protein CBE79_04570 [Priestia megaterium]
MNTFQMDDMMFRMHLEASKDKDKIEYIRKAITAEIATRNHQDMSEKEEGIMEGLLIASKIIGEEE